MAAATKPASGERRTAAKRPVRMAPVRGALALAVAVVGDGAAWDADGKSKLNDIQRSTA